MWGRIRAEVYCLGQPIPPRPETDRMDRWKIIKKNIKKPECPLEHSVVRITGLEPARGFPHTDLNRTRLPIPPYPRFRQSLKKWWREMDSNHRSLRRQIYSLLPLATRESLHS